MGVFKSLWSDLFGDEEPDFQPDPPEDLVPKELRDAEARCPEVKFVQSCRAFFNRRGFLSASQRYHLRYSGTPNRRYNQSYENDPEYVVDPDPRDSVDYGDNPFDPDRD